MKVIYRGGDISIPAPATTPRQKKYDNAHRFFVDDVNAASELQKKFQPEGDIKRLNTFNAPILDEAGQRIGVKERVLFVNYALPQTKFEQGKAVEITDDYFAERLCDGSNYFSVAQDGQAPARTPDQRTQETYNVDGEKQKPAEHPHPPQGKPIARDPQQQQHEQSGQVPTMEKANPDLNK